MCESMYICMYVNMYACTMVDSWLGSNGISGACLWSFSPIPCKFSQVMPSDMELARADVICMIIAFGWFLSPALGQAQKTGIWVE